MLYQYRAVDASGWRRAIKIIRSQHYWFIATMHEAAWHLGMLLSVANDNQTTAR